jgi:cyclic lactone autoinducer peptide
MRVKTFLAKMSKMVAPLALALAVLTANSTCFFLSYQPNEPERLKEIRFADMK